MLIKNKKRRQPELEMGEAPFEEGLCGESLSAGSPRLTPFQGSHAPCPGHLPISSLPLSPKTPGLLLLLPGSPPLGLDGARDLGWACLVRACLTPCPATLEFHGPMQ